MGISQAIAMANWTEGTQLDGGRYRIESPPKLGKDSTTLAYMAWDTRDKKRVAIETPNPGIVGDRFERIQNRFEEEALKLVRCEHPHIIRVQDRGLFLEEGLRCLPLEYLDGGTLENPASVYLEEAEALAYIRQISEALMVLHNRDMVHGDVQPANVHLWKTGEAVLTNFRLAREANTDWTHTDRPESWKGYAPLEAIARRPPTPQSDLYMLGATLYTLLTGRRPVDASDRLGGDHEEGQKLDFSRNNKDEDMLGDRLRTAILAAMELKAADRPASVEVWLRNYLGIRLQRQSGRGPRPPASLAYDLEKLKLIGIGLATVTAIVGLATAIVNLQNTQSKGDAPASTEEVK